MAKKKVNTNNVAQKRAKTDKPATKPAKRNFAAEAEKIKESIIKEVEGINVQDNDYKTQRDNINKIYKIRSGVMAATLSKDKNVDFTISSSEKIKELVDVSKKISIIMDQYVDKVHYLNKKGEIEEAIEAIKEQAVLQEAIKDAVEPLEKIIVASLRKGVGNKRDIEEQKQKDRKEAEAPIIALYQEGKLISGISKDNNLEIEDVKRICGPYRQDFIKANEAEIKKAILKKTAFADVANSFELPTKILAKTLDALAQEDEKLKAVIDAAKEARKKELEAKKAEKANTSDVAKETAKEPA